MLTQGYFITAEIKVIDPNRLDDTIDALEKLCRATIRNEPGCSLFCAHRSNTHNDRFILWERFDDETAFKQHFEEKHTKDYISLGLTDVVQFFQTNLL